MDIGKAAQLGALMPAAGIAVGAVPYRSVPYRPAPDRAASRFRIRGAAPSGRPETEGSAGKAT
jgi:hypothetical protein